MKPKKSWEPDYRFGGEAGSFYMPQPLGTKCSWKLPKTKKGKKKK